MFRIDTLRLRKWLGLVVLALSMGCAERRTSSIAPFVPGVPTKGKCGWVEVDESITNLSGNFKRQYERKLFYCCPNYRSSGEPNPVCKRARWKEALVNRPKQKTIKAPKIKMGFSTDLNIGFLPYERFNPDVYDEEIGDEVDVNYWDTSGNAASFLIQVRPTLAIKRARLGLLYQLSIPDAALDDGDTAFQQSAYALGGGYSHPFGDKFQLESMLFLGNRTLEIGGLKSAKDSDPFYALSFTGKYSFSSRLALNIDLAYESETSLRAEYYSFESDSILVARVSGLRFLVGLGYQF